MRLAKDLRDRKNRRVNRRRSHNLQFLEKWYNLKEHRVQEWKRRDRNIIGWILNQRSHRMLEMRILETVQVSEWNVMLEMLVINKAVDSDREQIVIIQLPVHKEMNEWQSLSVKSQNLVEN